MLPGLVDPHNHLALTYKEVPEFHVLVTLMPIFAFSIAKARGTAASYRQR